MNIATAYLSFFFMAFAHGISNCTTAFINNILEVEMNLVFSELRGKILSSSISHEFIESVFTNFIVDNIQDQNLDMLLDIISIGSNESIFLKLCNLKYNETNADVYKYIIDKGKFFLERFYIIPSQDNYELYCIASMRIANHYNAVYILDLNHVEETKQIVRVLKKYIMDKHVNEFLTVKGLSSFIYKNLICMDQEILSIIINAYSERLSELDIALNSTCDSFMSKDLYKYVYTYLTGYCTQLKHKMMSVHISNILDISFLHNAANSDRFMGLVDSFSVSTKNFDNMHRWKEGLVGKNIFVEIALMDPTSINIEIFGILERCIRIFLYNSILQHNINAAGFATIVYDNPTHNLLLRTLINSVTKFCVDKKLNLYIISRNFCTVLMKHVTNGFMDIYDQVMDFIRSRSRSIFIDEFDIRNEKLAKLLIEAIESYYTILINTTETKHIDMFQQEREMEQSQLDIVDDFMESVEENEKLSKYIYETTNSRTHFILSNLVDSEMAKGGNVMIRSRLNLAFSAATMIAQCSGILDALGKGVNNIVNFEFLSQTKVPNIPMVKTYLIQDDDLPIDTLDSLPIKYLNMVTYIRGNGGDEHHIDQKFLTTVILIAEDIFPEYDTSINDELTQVLENKVIVVAGLMKKWAYWGDYHRKRPTGFFVKVLHCILDIISLKYFGMPGKISVKRVYNDDPIKLLSSDSNVHMSDVYFVYNIGMMIEEFEPTFLPILCTFTYFIYQSESHPYIDRFGTFNDVLQYLSDETIPTENKFIVTLIGNGVNKYRKLFPDATNYYILPSMNEITMIDTYLRHVSIKLYTNLKLRMME